MADNTPQTILVVEDDTLLMNSIAEVLTNAGYKVLQARDGNEGLNIALKDHPNLVLTDNLMPILNGVDMVAKFRQDDWGKKVPVIIMTNMYNADTLNDSLEAGITDYVMKSDFSVDKVADLVRNRLKTS
jgi:DNA-binding response OmpR family regulator